MSGKKIAYVGCDTAYEQGVVTLFTEHDVIASHVMAEKMAHGKHICHAIEHAFLAAREFDLDIRGIFCGLGPGSFVGVRVVLATVLGFSFSRGLPVMGFCSHEAIANSYDHADRLFIYMKASGDLGYLTELTRTNHCMTTSKATEIVAISDVKTRCVDDVMVLSDQAKNLSDDCSNIVSVLGPTAQGIQQAALNKLVAAGSFADESAFIRPNYVKGPNVSVPKRSLIIDPQAQ